MHDSHHKVEMLIAHSLAYSFLGRSWYQMPDAELLQTLARDDLFAEWPLGNERTEIRAALDDLRDYCLNWQPKQIDALKRDYARLFVGPGTLLAYPWESVYRSNEHLIFEEQTLQVRQAYRAYGMEIPNLNREPEDHIGLELLFVAHLAGLALESLRNERHDDVERYIDAMRDFLHDHTLVWAQACMGRVRDNAETVYYRRLADLTLGCLAETAEAYNIEMPEAAE